MRTGRVTRLLAGAGGRRFPVVAGCATDATLVATVGAMKYQGLRGLVWPLATLAATGLRDVPEPRDGDGPTRTSSADSDDARYPGPDGLGRVDGLVPVPLHPTRQRERGFNQAQLLAQLVARRTGIPQVFNLVERSRRTRQQAKISATDRERWTNVRQAFRGRPATGDRRRLVVVDDLVTSGGTMLAVVEVLVELGWNVVGGLAVGLTVDGAKQQAAGGIDAGPRIPHTRQNVG